MEKTGRLFVCFLLMYGVQASSGFESTPLNLVVLPDTLNRLYPRDSVEFHAQITDRNGVAIHEYDSLIQWRLSDSSWGARLRSTSGPDNMYYAGDRAYVVNFIIVRFSNPPIFSAVLIDTVKVLIKAYNAYSIWIEPDTDINVNEINARLYRPFPVDSLVLDGPGDQKTLAAVKRDPFGNFIGFDTTVRWQELGFWGVVKVTTASRPYLCFVKGMRTGTTSVECMSGNVIFGTVTVIVKNATKTRPAGIALGNATSNIKREYFSALGRKLQGFGNSRVDGIVLERIIGPGGTMSVKKKFRVPDSGMRMQ